VAAEAQGAAEATAGSGTPLGRRSTTASAFDSAIINRASRLVGGAAGHALQVVPELVLAIRFRSACRSRWGRGRSACCGCGACCRRDRTWVPPRGTSTEAPGPRRAAIAAHKRGVAAAHHQHIVPARRVLHHRSSTRKSLECTRDCIRFARAAQSTSGRQCGGDGSGGSGRGGGGARWAAPADRDARLDAAAWAGRGEGEGEARCARQALDMGGIVGEAPARGQAVGAGPMRVSMVNAGEARPGRRPAWIRGQRPARGSPR